MNNEITEQIMRAVVALGYDVPSEQILIQPLDKDRCRVLIDLRIYDAVKGTFVD